MFLNFIEFWMDHGVDAFRCDIATFVPPSFWRAARRRVVGRQPGGAMLAEIIPPSVGFFDEQFDLAYHSYLYWNFKDIFAKTGGLDDFNAAMTTPSTSSKRLHQARAREGRPGATCCTCATSTPRTRTASCSRQGATRRCCAAAAGALLTLPGTPMIYYGDEQGRARCAAR